MNSIQISKVLTKHAKYFQGVYKEIFYHPHL